jgi:hypothetical protein
MKHSILIALIAGALSAADVQVKPLTDTQKTALKKATDDLEKAKAVHEEVVNGIKAAHGAYTNNGPIVNLGCWSDSVSAEIVGDLIIIRSSSVNICGDLGIPKPIK